MLAGLIVLILLYAIVLISIFFGYKKHAFFTANHSNNISVLVPFRNEEDNLEKCLESLLNQQFNGAMELILINDHSSDSSLKVIENVLKKHTNKDVSILHLPDGVMGKKQALKHAIPKAKYAIISTFDADCVSNTHWLQSVSDAFYNDTIKMVLGEVVVPYNNTFSGLLQHSESVLTSIFSIYGVKTNTPLLLSAANLAFRKEAFNEVNGYSSNEHLPSGDDIFLFEKFKKHFGNHCFGVISEVVYTNAVDSLKLFFSQRVRWFQKMKHAKNLVHTHLLSTFITTVNTSLLFTLFFYDFKIALMLLMMKFILDILLLSSSRHTHKSALMLSPLLLLWWLVYPLILLISTALVKPIWKGRSIN
jgi:biofilm PGA synthesis N-glycosyltransferase PgaC